jgi:hypothetical protein
LTTATGHSFRLVTPRHPRELSFGYLEGARAALEKGSSDVLVPPTDPRHPMWWVLPEELGNNPYVGLSRKLSSYCEATENRQKNLIDAFLAIAFQKSGFPAVGISTDEKKTDPWNSFLGDSSVSSAAFTDSPDTTREAIVEGYHLGIRALGVSLRTTAAEELEWPSKDSAQHC